MGEPLLQLVLRRDVADGHHQTTDLGIGEQVGERAGHAQHPSVRVLHTRLDRLLVVADSAELLHENAGVLRMHEVEQPPPDEVVRGHAEHRRHGGGHEGHRGVNVADGDHVGGVAYQGGQAALADRSRVRIGQFMFGGAVPGNYNPAATECWQEAVQIPPVRIVRRGELDADVLAILKANTRLPDSLWGDLNGQLAALELGARRLSDLLDEYGDGTVQDALAQLRERAVKLMRAHVAALPDGEYVYQDTLDNDGVRDEPLTIALRMRVAGESLTLDFTGTSPACMGPVNISRATAIAACYVALKHLFPDVPANAGVLDAVRFELPDGLLISAQRPRPVGGYTETILRMIDVIFCAMAQAAPERAMGQAYGTINALSIAGYRTDPARL